MRTQPAAAAAAAAAVASGDAGRAWRGRAGRASEGPKVTEPASARGGGGGAGGGREDVPPRVAACAKLAGSSGPEARGGGGRDGSSGASFHRSVGARVVVAASRRRGAASRRGSRPPARGVPCRGADVPAWSVRVLRQRRRGGGRGRQAGKNGGLQRVPPSPSREPVPRPSRPARPHLGLGATRSREAQLEGRPSQKKGPHRARSAARAVVTWRRRPDADAPVAPDSSRARSSPSQSRPSPSGAGSGAGGAQGVVEGDEEGGAAAVAEDAAVRKEAAPLQVRQRRRRHAAAGALVELLEDLAEAVAVERRKVHRRLQLAQQLGRRRRIERHAAHSGALPGEIEGRLERAQHGFVTMLDGVGVDLHHCQEAKNVPVQPERNKAGGSPSAQGTRCAWTRPKRFDETIWVKEMAASCGDSHGCKMKLLKANAALAI